MLAIGATATVMAPIPVGWREEVFLGCWASVVVSAASVHWPRGPSFWGALALSINAGIWCGAVIAVAASPTDLVKALPCCLVLWPAVWIIRRRVPVAIKVACSWLIAAALLAAALQFIPVTPGYLPDHIE